MYVNLHWQYRKSTTGPLLNIERGFKGNKAGGTHIRPQAAAVQF